MKAGARWSFIVGAALLLFANVGHHFYVGDYFTRRPVMLTVLEKERNARNFYLIVQREDGLRFSVDVGPATWKLSPIGSQIVLTLNEDWMEPSSGKFLASLGALVLGALGAALCIFALYDRFRKPRT